jgi:hypothetical protein
MNEAIDAVILCAIPESVPPNRALEKTATASWNFMSKQPEHFSRAKEKS